MRDVVPIRERDETLDGAERDGSAKEEIFEQSFSGC